MDVRDHTTASNGSLDQGVVLFIAADSKLKVARGDALHLKVLGGVTGELENLSSEVLKNGSRINSRSGTDAGAGVNSALQETVDSSHGELKVKKVKSTQENEFNGLRKLGSERVVKLELLLTWRPARADLD